MSDPSTKTTTASEYSIPAETHFREESGNDESLREKSKRFAHEAKRQAEQTFATAKRSTAATLDRAKQSATDLYGQSRDTIVESYSQRPLAYTVGAFAVGVVVGMLLPTSSAEGKLMSKAKRTDPSDADEDPREQGVGSMDPN